MILENINIRNFRNLSTASLKFNNGLNLICGDNGSGKTNLLESIYTLSTGRSFRTHNDRELLQWENDRKAEYTVISGDFSAADGLKRKVKVVINESQKRIYLNDKPIRSMTEYWGELNAVIFSPDDLDFVKGEPALRRLFMDREISQVSRKYLAAIHQYSQALKQRNTLLRSPSGLSSISSQIDIWERQMAEFAITIFRERLSYWTQWENFTQNIYTRLTAGNEQIKINYLHFLAPLVQEAGPDYFSSGVEQESDESIKRIFREALDNSRERDFERGYTTIGPHRDDVLILIEGLNARSYASQGQQRAFMLALRLAESHLFYKIKGEYPIIMLDDISSELDENRRGRLYEVLPDGAQIFITSVYPETLKFAPTASPITFWVKQGIIEPEIN